MATAPQSTHAAPATSTSSGMGTASLVVGILALVLFWFPIAGIVLGIIAIALGFSARTAGNAKAGYILGIIAVALSAILWIVALAL